MYERFDPDFQCYCETPLVHEQTVIVNQLSFQVPPGSLYLYKYMIDILEVIRF